MAGRESAFSNEKVVQWMKEDFVPVAVNVSYLQWQKDREGLFFMKIAEQGHYAGKTKPTATRQGLYVATIDGTLLASDNVSSTIKVMQLMQKGINGWNRGVRNSKGEFSSRNETDPPDVISFPQGGLILRQTIRDLPRRGQPHHKTKAHNFDHVWLTADEVKAFKPAKAEPGLSYDIPEKIVRRLVRWHLVDHVKGQAPGWNESEILDASMTATVTQFKTSASGLPRIRVKLVGKARCVAPPTGEVNPFTNDKITTDRGLEAAIRGWLTYDVGKKKFTDFKMLACGERWGTTTYNFRHQDLERSPIGFAFELLEVKPENKTKPAFSREGYFAYQE